MRPGKALETLRLAFSEWLQDDASLLAAALAYFGLFSFVPLLIIVLIIINSLFQHGFLGDGVAQQAQELAGRQVPVAAGDLIERAVEQAASFRFTLASIALLILGAAGLFVQTKRAFRIIWRLPGEETPLMDTVVSYLRSFLLIALVAFLLLATSVFTALLMPLGRQVEEALPVHLGLLRLFTFLISLALVTVLFTITYKALIEVELCWGEVLPGSALAALLFAAGNFVIEAYVGIVNFGSAYGAAGSLMVFLIWVYYSAQIFLFGAEVIKVLRRQRSMPGAANR
jgi:membrane protein